jgi:Protein of unknown function (DUF1501)
MMGGVSHLEGFDPKPALNRYGSMTIAQTPHRDLIDARRLASRDFGSVTSFNGATDELGFHAVEHPHYVTDLHATVLHLLGLNPRTLAYPGRTRLELDRGRVIHDILA